MVNLAQVKAGIEKYIENEILSKIPDWRKWLIGAAASRALSKSTDIFNQLKGSEMIKMLDVIDNNDMIDIDALYQEFSKQAQRGAITLTVPLIGPLTLNSGDVDKLYNAIIGG